MNEGRERAELPPGHFDCIPRAVWRLRREGRVSGADIDALAVLTRWAKNNRQLVLSALHFIARQEGWGKGNFQRSVKRLVKAGLLVPVKHPHYARNAYWIVWHGDLLAHYAEGETDSARSPFGSGEDANGLRAEAENGLPTEAGPETDSRERPKNGLRPEAETCGADDPGENGLGAESGGGLDVEAGFGLHVEAAHNNKNKDHTKGRARIGGRVAGMAPRERSPPGKGEGVSAGPERHPLNRMLEARMRKARKTERDGRTEDG